MFSRIKNWWKSKNIAKEDHYDREWESCTPRQRPPQHGWDHVLQQYEYMKNIAGGRYSTDNHRSFFELIRELTSPPNETILHGIESHDDIEGKCYIELRWDFTDMKAIYVFLMDDGKQTVYVDNLVGM